MNLVKRVKASITKPEIRLRAMMYVLRGFRRELQVIDVTTNPLTAIVTFFHTASGWRDHQGFNDLIVELDRLNDGQYDKILEQLRNLQARFRNVGRNQYGWNRAGLGESATTDNVWLGNVFGLFTKPVSYWQSLKDEAKGGWGYPNMEHLNAYDVVSRQAFGFVSSHIGPMISIIDELDRLDSCLAHR